MLSNRDPAHLIGVWSFERSIEDLQNEETSGASGSCELVPEGRDLILWRERAMLRHGGREFAASRDLRIERGEEGWHVKFDDGRYFHPWVPGEPVTHQCGADLYEGIIEFDGAADTVTSWQVIWRVRGPEKDLRIHTRLSRAGDYEGPR